MLSVEKRSLATDIGDRLLDLYVRRDEALAEGDLERIHGLQDEINEAAAQRSAILHSAERR